MYSLYSLLFWETGFWNKVCAAIQFEVCWSVSQILLASILATSPPYFYYMWGGLSQRLSKDMQKWSTAQIFVTPKLGSHDSWVTRKLILNYSAALVVMQLTPYLSGDCNFIPPWNWPWQESHHPCREPFTWFGLWRGRAGPEGMGFCVG